MALIEKYWDFTQEVPATSWDIDNVPEGAIDASITEVFADGGAILQPDAQRYAPYGIQLSMGVIPVAGKAKGKYYIEGNQVFDLGTNSVTINITQNGGEPTGSTF